MIVDSALNDLAESPVWRATYYINRLGRAKSFAPPRASLGNFARTAAVIFRCNLSLAALSQLTKKPDFSESGLRPFQKNKSPQCYYQPWERLRLFRSKLLRLGSFIFRKSLKRDDRVGVIVRRLQTLYTAVIAGDESPIQWLPGECRPQSVHRQSRHSCHRVAAKLCRR